MKRSEINHVLTDLFRLLFFVLFIILSTSCHRNKQSKRIVQLTQEEALDSLYAHNIPFEWFNASGKIQFKSNAESGKASFNLRIKKDSIIWMNLKKVGVEFARLLIKPDSIFIIYRFDKSFEKRKLSDFGNYYGIDMSFSNLQDFLVGNCLLPDTLMQRGNKEDKTWHFYGNNNELTMDYWVDEYTGKLLGYTITDGYNHHINTIYDKYQPIKNGEFYSYNREYYAPIDQENETFTKIKFSKVAFDIKKKIKFEIPAHYTKK